MLQKNGRYTCTTLNANITLRIYLSFCEGLAYFHFASTKLSTNYNYI